MFVLIKIKFSNFNSLLNLIHYDLYKNRECYIHCIYLGGKPVNSRNSQTKE